MFKQKTTARAGAPPRGGRTQDRVPLMDVFEQSMLLTDGRLVGAIGFSSIAEGVLHADAVLARLAAYGLMLKHMDGSLQLLMASRPQNCRMYDIKMNARLRVLGDMLDRARIVTAGLDAYFAAMQDAKRPAKSFDGAQFERTFGFNHDLLFGAPGRISHVLMCITSPDWVASQRAAGSLAQTAVRAKQRAIETEQKLEQWRRIAQLRARFVGDVVARLDRPARVLLMVTSVRTNGIGALAVRLNDAEGRLTQRLDNIAQTISTMGLPAWRLTGEDLVQELLRVYRPSQAWDAAKTELLDTTRLTAPGLLGIDGAQLDSLQRDLRSQLDLLQSSADAA